MVSSRSGKGKGRVIPPAPQSCREKKCFANRIPGPGPDHSVQSDKSFCLIKGLHTDSSVVTVQEAAACAGPEEFANRLISQKKPPKPPG